jgi:hypothetical protein
LSTILHPDLPPLYSLLWPAPNSPLTEPSPEQWAAIASQAREHRLRPLLHASAKQWPWPAPTPLVEDWARSSRQSAGRALAQRAELIRIGAALNAAGIVGIVLKGGAIAWRGWFDPALRPMRDLDLLVPNNDADKAQSVLRQLGFIAPEGPNPENEKHLPAMRSLRSGTVVEIHLHLIEPSGSSGHRDDRTFRDLAEPRIVPIPGTALVALSDTDTLLHLILHGALDHQFNNGPVLAFDVLTMLEHGAIDWTAFWDTAEAVGGLRASQLVLSFVAELSPGARIDWRGHAPTDLDREQLLAVAELMLIDRARRSVTGLPGRIARHGWRGGLGEVGRGIWRFALRLGRARKPTGTKLARSERVAASGSIHMIGQSLQIAKWLRGETR